MKKSDLTAAVEACRRETREALQELYDNVNKGQQKQLARRESIRTLFYRYGVQYEA